MKPEGRAMLRVLIAAMVLAGHAGAARAERPGKADANLLENSSCRMVCSRGWLGLQNCKSECTAVAAVRGGRELSDGEKRLAQSDVAGPGTGTPPAAAPSAAAVSPAVTLSPKEIYQKAG